jgi:hypothetical protein
VSTDNPGANAGNQQQQAGGGNRGRRDLDGFTVEFADDYCRNFTVTTPPLQGIDIRGRWDTSRLAKRPQGMRDLGQEAVKIPSPIPGAYLLVDIARGRIRLEDPCETTEAGKAVLEQYNKVAKGVPSLREKSPFVALEYKVDDDQLKTLLLELHRKKESNCITMVEGELPTIKQIESLPGDELYDPSNQGEDKPRYKKDLQKFRDRQRAAGV